MRRYSGGPVCGLVQGVALGARICAALPGMRAYLRVVVSAGIREPGDGRVDG